MNVIYIIAPYKWNGIWVFDDENVGLKREAFVSGADTLIDRIVKMKNIPKPGKGFLLMFSETPMPEHDAKLVWESGDKQNKTMQGNYYTVPALDNHQAWLCPALFHYFTKAPKEIYVRALPKRTDYLSA